MIRGGYGIYYNYTMNLALFRLGSNPPWATHQYLHRESWSAADHVWITRSRAQRPELRRRRTMAMLTNDFGVGYSQLRSLHLSQQLGNNDAIEIGYSGNFALGGDRNVNANDAPPGPGAIQPRRRFPQYGVLTEVRSDAKSFYNAGTAKYTRRFSDGLTVLSSYTFSRSIDQAFSSVAGNPTGGAFRRPTANLSQRGLSSSHRKHVWTTSAVYELPFGKGRASSIRAER